MERVGSSGNLQWSVEELQAWIDASDEGFTSGMGWRFAQRLETISKCKGRPARSAAELASLVEGRLDRLYSNWQPIYQGDAEVFVERQPPWTMLAIDGGPDVPIHGRNGSSSGLIMRALAGGTLERCFHSSLALHERMEVESRRHGLHPADDFRRNLSTIAKTLDVHRTDNSAPCFMLQDPNQTVGCIISVQDIRKVLEGPTFSFIIVCVTYVALTSGWRSPCVDRKQ